MHPMTRMQHYLLCHIKPYWRTVLLGILGMLLVYAAIAPAPTA